MTELYQIRLGGKDAYDYWTGDRVANAIPIEAPAVQAVADEFSAIVENSAFLETQPGVTPGSDDRSDDLDDLDPDGTFSGQPKPVPNAASRPWRCVGRLTVAYPDGTNASGTGVVVGAASILTCAHLFNNVHGLPVSALFIPAFRMEDNESRYHAPFGEWQVETLDIPTQFKGRSAQYARDDIFFDFALVTVGSRYRVAGSRSPGAGPVYRNGSIGEVLGAGRLADGILEIDSSYLPRDADAEPNIKLTCIGYPGGFGNGLRMYQQTDRYMGSLINKRSGSQGPTPKGLSMFQGRTIPADAAALQVFNSRFQDGASGAPLLRRDRGGAVRIVGIRIAGSSVIGYSPTFASQSFRDFLLKHQAGG